MKTFIISVVIACFSACVCSCSEDCLRTDVLIVGGGASGTAAGIQSSRLGVKSLIVEETPWLGGMLTAAGVSATDGNYNLPSGFWGEFRDSLANRYGGLDSLKTGWVSHVQFEPHVGNEIFHNMCGAEKNLTVLHGYHVTGMSRNSGRRWTVRFEDEEGSPLVVDARIVIDATELGDVIPLAGVRYDIGMESRYDTGEDIAPEDPNGIIQDLTFCATLKDYGTDVTISEPEGYDPQEFACCAINPLSINPKEPDRMWPKDMMITYGKLPNGKYMINWPIEGNDYYVNMIEMTRKEREEAVKAAKAHTMRFIYFIQHQLGFNTLGLADDEYGTDDLLPYIPYHRESRRVHGLVRFTCNHVSAPYSQKQPLYRTSIAVGDYPVDHHHTRYTGSEELPRLYFYPVPSFGLPLGALIPQDVEDFIVAEKSISVSNIVNGATRLQPVVLQIGQVAGITAALALQHDCGVSEVDVREVQETMLEAGGIIQPYLDVPMDSPLFKVYQRIGSTGLLHGEGRNADWVDQFWLRAGDPLMAPELETFTQMYGMSSGADGAVTLGEVVLLISGAAGEYVGDRAEELLSEYGFAGYDEDRICSRGEFALLADRFLDPFHSFKVGIDGNLL